MHHNHHKYGLSDLDLEYAKSVERDCERWFDATNYPTELPNCNVGVGAGDLVQPPGADGDADENQSPVFHNLTNYRSGSQEFGEIEAELDKPLDIGGFTIAHSDGGEYILPHDTNVSVPDALDAAGGDGRGAEGEFITPDTIDDPCKYNIVADEQMEVTTTTGSGDTGAGAMGGSASGTATAPPIQNWGMGDPILSATANVNYPPPVENTRTPLLQGLHKYIISGCTSGLTALQKSTLSFPGSATRSVPVSSRTIPKLVPLPLEAGHDHLFGDYYIEPVHVPFTASEIQDVIIHRHYLAKKERPTPQYLRRFGIKSEIVSSCKKDCRTWLWKSRAQRESKLLEEYIRFEEQSQLERARQEEREHQRQLLRGRPFDNGPFAPIGQSLSSFLGLGRSQRRNSGSSSPRRIPFILKTKQSSKRSYDFD